MGRSSILIDKLIKITIEVMLINKLDNLDNIPLSRKRDSIWSQISFKYFNYHDYINALRISKIWKRNVQKYATIVKNTFCNKKMRKWICLLNKNPSKMSF